MLSAQVCKALQKIWRNAFGHLQINEKRGSFAEYLVTHITVFMQACLSINRHMPCCANRTKAAVADDQVPLIDRLVQVCKQYVNTISVKSRRLAAAYSRELHVGLTNNVNA